MPSPAALQCQFSRTLPTLHPRPNPLLVLQSGGGPAPSKLSAAGLCCRPRPWMNNFVRCTHRLILIGIHMGEALWPFNLNQKRKRRRGKIGTVLIIIILHAKDIKGQNFCIVMHSPARQGNRSDLSRPGCNAAKQTCCLIERNSDRPLLLRLQK